MYLLLGSMLPKIVPWETLMYLGIIPLLQGGVSDFASDVHQEVRGAVAMVWAFLLPASSLRLATDMIVAFV